MSWVGAMYVVVGGAFGALCRYAVMHWSGKLLAGDFPYGTMIVNVFGSFLIGVWIAYVAYTLPEKARELHLLIAIGALGGFTTFSTFAADIFVLANKDNIVNASMEVMLYIGLSLAFSIGALIGGMRLVRMFFV